MAVAMTQRVGIPISDVLRGAYFLVFFPGVLIIRAMSKILEELYQNPKLGFIRQESWFGRTTIMVQYWESFEKLENYAKKNSSSHLPAWAEFDKKVGSNGDVGILHETYLSQKGKYESVYSNMPQFGLAKVSNCIPATGKFKAASNRISVNDS